MEGDLSFWLPTVLVVAAASALTLYSAWNRKGKGRYLCDDCRFNNPDDCLKIERPRAVSCLSYRTLVEAKQLETKTEAKLETNLETTPETKIETK
ncbi:MAG: hypothetical protein DKT66_07705 [Candidatus Melainabacteria bacterium]|nr:MAG: hypothetical protein DKT66_07705 [Candidatus Melainabacteria bacterium]